MKHIDYGNVELRGGFLYEKHISLKGEKLKSLAAGLDALSPLKILSRGYAFVENDKDEIIDSVSKITEESILKLNFSDGKAICKVSGLEGGN